MNSGNCGFVNASQKKWTILSVPENHRLTIPKGWVETFGTNTKMMDSEGYRWVTPEKAGFIIQPINQGELR